MLQKCVFDVSCVPSSCGRMELSGFLCTVPLTLMAVSIIVPATSDAYSSLSLHHASGIYGELNCTYDLNVSSTTPVSIFYNESHRQVITVYFYICLLVRICDGLIFVHRL